MFVRVHGSHPTSASPPRYGTGLAQSSGGCAVELIGMDLTPAGLTFAIVWRESVQQAARLAQALGDLIQGQVVWRRSVPQ